MTLYQFNSLDETQQANVLWEYGVHISERPSKYYNLILYQLDGFYVEVWYHPEENSIKRLRSFSSTDQLEPYLSKIKIKI